MTLAIGLVLQHLHCRQRDVFDERITIKDRWLYQEMVRATSACAWRMSQIRGLRFVKTIQHVPSKRVGGKL